MITMPVIMSKANAFRSSVGMRCVPPAQELTVCCAAPPAHV